MLVVHPERNRQLCRLQEELTALIASGVRLVGNIGSFSGMYGHEVQRDARKLLMDGHYWAMASDIHSPDQSPWIREGIDELASLAGGPAARVLMADRPMQLVMAMEGDL